MDKKVTLVLPLVTFCVDCVKGGPGAGQPHLLLAELWEHHFFLGLVIRG